MTQRILVAGGGGLLGRAVVSAARSRGHEVAAPGRSTFDLLDADSLQRGVGEFGPDWIVNCAAWTDVDGAESREEEARALNAGGAGALARAAKSVGAALLHLSTDYVFDGTARAPVPEDAPRNPINAYGRTKAEGEDRVREVGGRWLIVRTSWLYGAPGRDFVDRILSRAGRGEALRVVDDQAGRPTWSGSLAAALVDLVEADAGGVLHVADAGEATWHDLATEAVRLAGLDAPVHPVPSTAFQTAATRPAYSVLSLTRAEEVLGRTLPHWKDSLARYLLRERSGALPLREG